MMKAFILLMTVIVTNSCSREKVDVNPQANQTSATIPATVVTPSASAGEQPAPGVRETSVVSLSAGALVVKSPQEFDAGKWSAIRILDESPKSGWATPKGVTSPQTIVIALAEKTLLKSVEFDTAGIDGEGRGAREISVEVSDTNENDGFQKIAEVSLQSRADNQKFAVNSEVPGRWVRLTIKSNHGSAEYIELFDFRAAGRQLTQTPFHDVSGTYETNWGDFHLKQEGTNITGCYEYKGGSLIDGGIEGRVIKFVWTESNAKGPAIMVFTPDASQMYGLWWYEGYDWPEGVWKGTKKSSSAGTCRNWSGGVEKQLAKQMEEFGRVRVYGINFDIDSDRIKEESKPTLDKIVAMLKARADWKITVEGHTDSTSTPQHNQDLSERRATAVKNYLQTAGIDASRVQTVGYGATRPVMKNDSELGRAQNRRVELTKQ
jgi:outer membrane protein OmpA-like peptidoglycan-associated protein